MRAHALFALPIAGIRLPVAPKRGDGSPPPMTETGGVPIPSPDVTGGVRLAVATSTSGWLMSERDGLGLNELLDAETDDWSSVAALA